MPRLPALPSRRLPIDVAKRFAGVPSYDRPRQLLRVLSEPEPGYFVLRQARGGAWVPAIIWRPCPLILPDRLEETAPGPEDWCLPTDRPRPLRARIGDDEANPLEVWERGRTDPLVIERQLTPERAYDYRMEDHKWAVAYAPASPEANPKKPADLGKLPSLF